MTTLKGIFPNPKPPKEKNYLQENVKSLRRMEKYFHTNKAMDKLPLDRPSNKYQNIGPRVNSSLRGSYTSTADSNRVNINCQNNTGHSIDQKLSTSVKGREVNSRQQNTINRHRPPDINTKQKKMNKDKFDLQNINHSLPDALNLISLREDINSPRGSSGKFTNCGSQTLDTTNIDAIYSEGVIRYPSSRSDKVSGVPEKNKKIGINSPTDCGDTIKNNHKSKSKEALNYIEANKEIPVATKMAMQLNNGILPPNYRKGVIPKYIIERKEERFQQQVEKAKIEATLAECPPGHLPLPDNERKETLRMLIKNYEGLVNELNKLPIRSDTLKSQVRKRDLEQRLKKLEDGIKVFSRPKVFIKTGE